MSALDSFLNRITLYRLVLLVLWILAGISIGESMLHWSSYPAIELIISLLILLLTTRAVNSACALFTRSTPSPEGAYTTALILFFILSPIQSSLDGLFFMLAAAIAILSKYLLVLGRKHIFNPAALAALVLSLAGTGLVTWWVLTPLLLPFILVGGFIVLRKARQFELFWYFSITAYAVILTRAGLGGVNLFSIDPLISSATALVSTLPLFFVGAFMLTDPQTMPNSQSQRRIFGMISGGLLASAFGFIPPSAMPAFALLIGNLYAFVVNRTLRTTLSFHSMHKVSREVYEFAFESLTPVHFKPGQYIEAIVGHKSPDKRGIRRYFSLVSAPADPYVRLAVQIPIESSSFKKALSAFKKKSTLNEKASQLTFTSIAGSFTLPADPEQKILAVADGVGIAPFMSMLRHLAHRRERRHMVLVYTALTPLDFAYYDEIESLKELLDLKVLYVPMDFSELSGWDGPSGYLTDALIQKEVPDFQERLWYISGPSDAVTSLRMFAKNLGVPSSNIKLESFPGF